MPTIQTLTGNVNMRKQSAKIHAFHSPRKGGVGNKEVFLDKASKSGVTSGHIRKVGVPEFCAAIPGTKQEIGGRFVKQTFDIEEGEILKLFVDVRPGYGNPKRTGSVFIRVRRNAAHRKIRIKMIDHADVAYTHAEVEGCFDVLTLNELDAAGVKVLKGLRHLSSEANLERIISENIVIQPEVSAPVRVRKRKRVDADGNEQTVFERKKRRSLDI